MSTLIVYMSRHSTTEKVVEMIKRGLIDSEIEVVNLRKSKTPDLNKFDKIIIGGSIHAGTIQKRISKFCITDSDILLKKKLGLFICHMEIEKAKDEFDSNYPEVLRNHASANGLLGGEFLFEKMNYFEKLIIRKVSKVNSSVSKLKSEAITEFISKMNG